jgi:hypothetical protein
MWPFIAQMNVPLRTTDAKRRGSLIMAIKFTATFKQSDTELAKIFGRPIENEFVTMADMNKVIEIEQWFDRVFGVRLHIFSQEVKDESEAKSTS